MRKRGNIAARAAARLALLDRILGAHTKTDPKNSELELCLFGRAEPVTVALKRHPRARRMSLKVDPALGGPVLTLPRRTSRRAAERFVLEHEDWLARAIADLPPTTDFADGTELTVMGERLTVRHRPDKRAGVRRSGDEIEVSGRIEHLPRRLTDFLKKHAKAEIGAVARDLAAQLGAAPGRITVRDTRSRWGSCSARGDLSFSWRLILAPPDVMHYVAAHEVAHLRHMDHSPAFWRTVASLHPDYERTRRWLSENGAALHRIG